MPKFKKINYLIFYVHKCTTDNPAAKKNCQFGFFLIILDLLLFFLNTFIVLGFIFKWLNFYHDVFMDVIVAEMVLLHDLGKEEENVFG